MTECNGQTTGAIAGWDGKGVYPAPDLLYLFRGGCEGRISMRLASVARG